MSSLFDFVHAINNKEYNFNETVSKKEYNQYIINKAFSFYSDTVLFANEMNMCPPSSDWAHYDFYYYGLDKRKRFAKWPKKEEDDLLPEVAEYYEVSLAKAKEILSVLTQEQKIDLKQQLDKGGKDDRRSRSKNRRDP